MMLQVGFRSRLQETDNLAPMLKKINTDGDYTAEKKERVLFASQKLTSKKNNTTHIE